MKSVFLFLAALFGFLAVAFGAFGAHALKTLLSPEMMEIYKTAVNYQMWHALLLGLVAYGYAQNPSAVLLKWSGWVLTVGIVLFSGSLYLLVLTGIRSLGAITPLGGVCFLIGWVLLGIFAFRPDKLENTA